MPQIDSHLTAKLYVDNAVDEPSLIRNNRDNDFGDYNLSNINSIMINNNPTKDNHATNKKYIDDELDKNRLVRFNHTLKNYLKVTVGGDIYNLTKYNKILLTDVTEIIYPESGHSLLPRWKIYCNNRNNQSRIDDFKKSSITQSPSYHSGPENLPPIGSSFMYIETTVPNHGSSVFTSWERRDIIQITNITFYYNRYSILTNDNLKNMGRLRIQLLLENDTWATQYNIEKK